MLSIRPTQISSASQKIIALVAVAATTLCASATAQSKANQSGIDLSVRFPKNEQIQVVSELEHEGAVVLAVGADMSKRKVQTLPMKVSADLEYAQRVTGPNQVVRYFKTAKAEIKLANGTTRPQLSKNNRLIIARLKKGSYKRVEMASITETLQQEEHELLQTLADPLTLESLIEKDDAVIGESWKPSDLALAKFLNIDRIKASSTKLQLKTVENGVARVYISGEVSANQNDVLTNISLAGYLKIDVKNHQVLSLKLSTDEKRPAGQISPGFQGRTRVDQSFTHGVTIDELSNSSLATAMRSNKVQQRLKFVSNRGMYQINFDPRWKLIAGEDDSAIMRFIDQGDLLTQCNVVLLPRRAANQPLTLKQYKTEIAKVIEADENALVVKAGDETTATGLKALRVIVSGEEDGLPVNWIYYHVASKDGRQITFVFSLAESVAGRVTGAAQQLVDEFRFLRVPEKVARKTNQYRSPAKKTNR
jgi:hypothetical protein